MKYVDLHTHSTSSDGTFTPSELAAYAARKGLAAFALTDHDTTDGLAEAEAAAAEHGIEFVPGIEFSTDYDGHDIHIVGLDIDRTQKDLTERLQAFRQNRDARNEEMLELLRTVGGFAITMEDLRRSYGQDTVITRAHFGRWLFEHGCVKSISEAFDRYLGDGCPCFVEKKADTPGDRHPPDSGSRGHSHPGPPASLSSVYAGTGISGPNPERSRASGH